MHFVPIFSFRVFVFVGFFLYHLEAVFTSAHFSLTTNVSHGNLYLVLGFVGIQFTAASRYALTKFSYSLFGVLFLSSPVVFRICSSILIHIYLQYLCGLEGPSHCFWWSLFVWRIFHRLNRIFAMIIQWLEDTPSKEEYASQFIVLFFHFLFIKM